MPSLSQCLISQSFARGHCATLWFRRCRAPCSSAKTSTMQVSSGAFFSHSTNGMVEQFFRFALRVSSITRHGHKTFSASHCLSSVNYPQPSSTTVHSHFRHQFGQLVFHPFFAPMVCACLPYCQNVKNNQCAHFSNHVFPLVLLGSAVWLAALEPSAASHDPREPQSQWTVAHCHFGREAYIKNGYRFFERQNSKDHGKHQFLTPGQVLTWRNGRNSFATWVG